MKRRLSVIGSFDPDKKEMTITITSPCPSADMAEKACGVYGEMLTEAIQKAIEKMGGDVVKTTTTEAFGA